MKQNKGKTNKKSYSKDNKRTGKEFSRREDSRPHAESESKLGNDISWYVADPQILTDVASFPFSNVLSDEFSIKLQGAEGSTDMVAVTPGICLIKYVPSYGFMYDYTPDTSRAKTDPLNIATKSVYSFVRKHNSGSANYDEVDLMQYYLAMDSVYSFWAYLVRVYGILRVYNYKNRYIPNALLGALGFPTSSSQRALYSSMAQLRYLINNMAIRMSSLAVPTVMPIFQRHVWMNTNIFKDCDDPKAQMFVFRPAGYYVYDEIGGSLNWTAFNDITGSSVLSTLQGHIDAMLEPLLYSQSIGIMSGDTLKAYEGNVFTFSTIPEDFVTLPIYNEKILPQIHNLNTADVNPVSIDQVDNTLINRFTVRGTNYDNQIGATAYRYQYDELLLNMPYDNPNPEDVMYATRLLAQHIRVDADDTKHTIYAASEVPISISLIDDAKYGSTTVDPDIDVLSSRTVIPYGNINPDIFKIHCMMNQFDWGPRLGVFQYNAEDDDLVNYMPACDIANYTTISSESLANLHQAALCGLFGVPYTLTRA